MVPDQELIGENSGDVVVIGWGGTYGPLITAIEEMQDEGHKVSLAHFNYINPLPANTTEVMKGFRKRLVCELNLGQFASYLRMKYPQFEYLKYNKIQGLPFMISELKAKFKEILEEIS